MRKSYLFLLGAFGMTASAFAASPEKIELPADFNPWNLNHKIPQEQIERSSGNVLASLTTPPRKLRNPFKEAAEPNYFMAAQKYHEGYTFKYEGGDIVAYSIGIEFDGDKVIISNFFNLAAQSTEWNIGVDYDVVGTYDPVANTITIPTPNDLETGTIAGNIGGYYDELLLAGNVDYLGNFYPEDELVFNIIGDFEAITTDQSFGIYNFSPYGNLGAQALYRQFYAMIPTEEPYLLSFKENYELGETYPGFPIESTFTVVNMSSAEVDYAMDVDSDGDTFSVNPDGGIIDAKSIQQFTVTFLPEEVGEYEGMVYVDYEGSNEVLAFYYATAIPMPDYSGAVKSGEFEITTNIEYPFEMVTLEDGTLVARSGTHGQYGTSKLNVEFDVPEGNIGTFSWKGEAFNNGYWYQNAAGYFIDNDGYSAESWTAAQTNIDRSLEFAPGHHSVRFQYDGMYYTGDENNHMYVYDLELINTPAEADKVVVETPVINLGNFMVKDEYGIEGYGSIILRNKGSNPLTVSEISTGSSNLTATAPSGSAQLLETLNIPLVYRATDAEEFNTTVTITTSAGVVTADVTAKVRKMADFTSVVTEGMEVVTGFSVNEQYPFEVENGVAYNANSGEADESYTDSWFQINFTIPEGKAGYVTWDGIAYYDFPDPENNPYNYDYAGIEYSHPMNSGGRYLYPNTAGNPEDASSNCYANDEFWADKLICIPGDHYFRFHYIKNGDGHISDKDRVEISNFRIRIEDFNEYACEPDRDEVVFEEPIYVGDNRYSTTTVKIKNTGSQTLEILDVDADHPFYGIVPSWNTAQFNGTVEVGIWFYPSEEGEFEGTLTFKTNAGDVPIHCYGSTKKSEGILLIGDVENEGADWGAYDMDGDGETWNLGYNLWGLNPAWVHSGNDCFGSTSYSPYTGAVEPDNWLFSPVVTVPEDGAILQWFAASHHHERYAEHYSVYITIPEMVGQPEYLLELDPIFSETLEPESADEWVEHTIDLGDYAGENIVILFRHHDCSGQYVLKVDDIFVFTHDRWDIETGVESITGNKAELVSTEIYDINGIRVRGLQKGINIIRKTYSDGTVKSSKLIVNE